jgi:hypothetical protein
MKARVYIALLILVVLFSFQIVKAGGPLELSGKISSIEIEDKKDSVLVAVHVRISFNATGDEPVLLWKQTYPDEVLNGRFLCTNSKILGMLAAEKEEKILYYHNCALPSIQRTPAWQNARKRLDSKTLPLDEVQIIKRGESFVYDDVLKFIFSKKRSQNSNDPLWGQSSDHDVLWDQIKYAQNLSLSLTYRVWSPELEPRSANQEEKPFGKTLQKRWKEYGYLWLDDIQSEPIELDLKTAVVR